MAPLPLAVIAIEFGAAIAFGAILDVVKIQPLLASEFPEQPRYFSHLCPFGKQI